jgi:hypothetical protein
VLESPAPEGASLSGVLVGCSGWMWCGVGEPAGEVAAEPVQVGAGGAVADVSVGSDEVVRGVVDTKLGERLPVDVVQGARAWPGG